MLFQTSFLMTYYSTYYYSTNCIKFSCNWPYPFLRLAN